jgi:circadian clock protein KaiC
VVCIFPEVASLEDHFIYIQDLVLEFKPNRIAIDSLSALSQNPSEKGFREFVIALSSFLKQQEITSMFTATTPLLTGGTSVAEGNIATISDTIILLRYVEMTGEIQRCITILKMRGSKHDSSMCTFTIDEKGMEIGKPLKGMSGILSGNPVVISLNQ